MRKRKKKPQKKTHFEIERQRISYSILEPKAFLKSKDEEICNRFFEFLASYNNKYFDDILIYVLNNNTLRGMLNANCNEISDYGNRVVSAIDFPMKRLLQYYITILRLDESEIFDANLAKKNIVSLIFWGRYNDAEILIENYHKDYGYNLQILNLEYINLSIQGKTESLSTKFNEYINTVQNPFFKDYINHKFWIAHSNNAILELKNTALRDINELLNVECFSIASLWELTCLPFPMYGRLSPSESLYYLQILNKFDLYKILTEILIRSTINTKKKITFKNQRSNLQLTEEDLKEFFLILNSKPKTSKDQKEFKSKSEFNNRARNLVIKLYNRGKLKTIISLYENFLNKSITGLSIFNILAKSYITLNLKPTNKTPSLQKEVLSKLINIYKLENTINSINELTSLAIKYQATGLDTEVILCMSVAVNSALSEENKRVLNYYCDILDVPRTPLAKDLQLTQTFIDDGMIKSKVHHQIIKSKFIKKIQSNNIEDAKVLLSIYSKSCPIPKDIIDMHVIYYAHFKETEKLIDYAADLLVSNSEAIICFPKEDMKKFILDESVFNIQSVIFAYFYEQTNETITSGFLNEVFSEFLYENNVDSPSEYLARNEIKNSKEVYLFRNIANVTVIDFLGIFDNTTELYLERLKILSQLISKNLVDQSDLLIELNQTIEKVMVKATAAQISNSKISIDTGLIKLKRSKEIEQLIEVYNKEKLEEYQDYKSMEFYHLGDKSDQSKQFYVTGGSDNTLVRILALLITDFTNELDINLSSEIRHGFFSNLMSAKLQEKKLITEVNELGEYSSNKYWMEYYNIFNQNTLEHIDSALKIFSAKFDNILTEAESWMRVGVSGDISDAVFKIDIYNKDLNDLIILINKNSDVDYVIDNMFELLSKMLDECLIKMKKKLNEELVLKIDKLIQNTKFTLIEEHNNDALSNLFETLDLANDELKENIQKVCEWFSVKTENNYAPVPVSSVISIAEECFKQSIHSETTITREGIGRAIVAPKHLSSIVIALINLLKNAVKHGHNGSQIKINVETISESSYKISMINLMDVNKFNKNKKNIFKTFNKIDKLNDDSLLIKEGGSGLYKSKYFLKKSSANFSFIPEIIEDKFLVTIIYE